MNARNAGSSTALHEAVARRDVENVKLLLEKRADPSLTDASGRTPLDHAQLLGYAELVDLLKEAERRARPS